MIVYLDAGHGGLHPVTKRYVTAPSKMFNHLTGEFHSGTLFFEGVSNRTLADEFVRQCPLPVVKIYDPWMDTRLVPRCNLANRHWALNKRPKAIGISFHSDAGGGKGWSVYTSPGQTKSDVFAEILWNEIDKALPVRMRSDMSDGDHDKEDRFTILTRTDMPFVLTENLFFDNFDEACLLMDPEFRVELIKPYVKAVEKFFNL